MDKGFEYLFGVNPILEALKARRGEIAEIILTDGPQRPVLHTIAGEARRLGVKLVYMPPRALDRLIQGQRHQGVLAKVAAYSYMAFPELLQNMSSRSGRQWILILDGLTDPGNFGALLRTAEAVGVLYVVIPEDRSVGVTSAVVKASAGAVHHLKICRVTNLRRAISALKDRQFWITGLDATASDSIHDRIFPERLGIVLGSEADGIRPLILKQCDYLVSIPMRGKLKSLNVAVAGAVFLYELLRQSKDV